MKREIDVCLGIQWSDPDFGKTASATEKLLQALDNSAFKRDLPIHWLIPAYPFLECKHHELNNLILEIRTRIKTLSDVPVAVGYSGACLPLLAFDEMERELSWSITNPWKSGIKDTFGSKPEILIPEITVLSGKEYIDLYRDKDFKYIGINNIFPPVFEDYSGNELTFFCYQRISSRLLWTDLRKMIRHYLREKYHYLFFIIDINSNVDIGGIESIWQNFLRIQDWLSKHYIITFNTITRSNAVKAIPLPGCLKDPVSIGNFPELRRRLAAVDKHKIKKEKKTEDYKNILMLLSASAAPGVQTGKKEKNSRQLFPPADRVSDCTMQGNTILAGSDFAGNFLNGKLYNLEDNQGNDLLVGETAKSYMKIQKKEYQFQNLSSFSVGGEYTRGLRESLKIAIPGNIHDGSQVTEYIFIDDFPFLIVSSCIKYPLFDSKTVISTIALFEFPLFFIDKPIQVFALSTGAAQAYTLEPGHSLYTIPASLAAIPRNGTNILFGFPPEKNIAQGIIEFKIRQHKKRFLLLINLFGTYTPVEAKQYHKTTEIFSFYIGVSPVVPGKLPYFPAKILKELPDQVILDE